ncbi:MAG: adenine methylase [Desulfovibrionales bacterium]|jgi:DNA adenine methylase|nr:adenine methylase [Desulfovibrionales bacterium]
MLRSPFGGWIGGKKLLRGEIVRRIPEHLCYVEVCAGAGWALFAKEPSTVEVINDTNHDLVNLYRVVQNHLEEFVRHFKWVLTARDEFQRQLKAAPDTLTDIQRAARYYYLLKNSFGGRMVHPSFGTSAQCMPRLNLLRLEEDLSAAHLRLARVTVENMTYNDLIPRYDRDKSFFYVDPPYWGTEKHYPQDENSFGRDDFAQLADLAKNIKGKMLVSMNDVPEIRQLFAGLRIEPVQTKYSVGQGKPKAGREVFISNY